MYKTILCAIEASTEGKLVLAKAAAMAKLYNSKLLVMHVLPYKLLPKDYQKELKEKVTPKIEELCVDFGVTKKNRIIKVGKPYELICNEAIKRKADLIMLGTHSKKGIQALIGSTANGVANYADCDVSLVRIAKTEK
ncbi:universal stress protein [Aliiglaciecola lipolytica]|uniref:Universal stress protein n=1 Tax=Aliiglaciecola lipolytica E3 TaxID=1127673 RepID=K6X4S8_9ALTE|nr:universal stress protein [Aliiglaciecola lipolytica]GAC15634.1 universal stress protein A homolog 2 [Aliiglaciecola lipolytica E3]